MKTILKKQRGILVVLMSLFLVVACQNDNESVTAEDEVALDDELALRSAEIDLISDDIGLIVDDAAQEYREPKRASFSNCLSFDVWTFFRACSKKSFALASAAMLFAFSRMLLPMVMRV